MSINEPVSVQLVVKKFTNSVDVIRIFHPHNIYIDINSVDMTSNKLLLSYDNIFRIKRHGRKHSIPIKFNKAAYIE